MSEQEKSVEPPKKAEPPPLPRSADPFELQDLSRGFKLPHRVLEIILAQPDRLVSSIASRKHILVLIGLLLYTSVLFTLPFGAVLELSRFWKVVLLFVGSFAICFPSLQVFSAYVGCRIDTAQNLALGLVITSVAALFTFGFFPILWFLKATMLDESKMVTPHHIALVLLIFSLLAGIGHLYRCFFRLKGQVSSSPVLMFAWQVLFIYITYRMAVLLDLL